MAKALDAHADELAELVAQHFGGDRNTAVQHQIKEMRREAAAGVAPGSAAPVLGRGRAQPAGRLQGRGRARGEALPASRTTKLIEKLAQLEGEVQRLHDAREAEAELAAERERGTGKGRAFEQQRLRAGRADRRRRAATSPTTSATSARRAAASGATS